jgi:hypothetical protein
MDRLLPLLGRKVVIGQRCAVEAVEGAFEAPDSGWCMWIVEIDGWRWLHIYGFVDFDGDKCADGVLSESCLVARKERREG